MPPQPRRRTWLGPIRVLLALMLVSDIVAVPILLFGHGQIRIGRAIAYDLYPPGTRPRFPQLGLSDVVLLLPRSTLGQDLLYATGHGLAFVVATVPMIVYARRLTYEAMTGDPFTPRMVHRLRTLGAMVLIGGLLSEAAEYVANRVLLGISLPNDELLRFGARVDEYPTLWWLLPGLILLAVAEVVRRGCELRAELDGVI